MDGEAEPRHLTMRLINPMYFRRQSVTNIKSVLLSRGPHFVGNIQLKGDDQNTE